MLKGSAAHGMATMEDAEEVSYTFEHSILDARVIKKNKKNKKKKRHKISR